MTQIPDTLLTTVPRGTFEPRSSATCWDTLGRHHQFLPPAIQPAVPGTTLVGRAMPLLEIAATPDERSFGLMFEGPRFPGGGTRSMSAAAGAPPFALWGELMNTRALGQGGGGRPCSTATCAIRGEVRAMALPVFARGSYRAGSAGPGPGHRLPRAGPHRRGRDPGRGT